MLFVPDCHLIFVIPKKDGILKTNSSIIDSHICLVRQNLYRLKKVLDNINNIIYSDGGAQNLDELQEQLAIAYTEFYPSYYGVYDKHGKLVFKNSSYIQSDDIGFIPVDANDEVTEQYLLFDKELTSYPVIDKFCYVTENNKIVPTKLYFVSADESIDKNASNIIITRLIKR